MPFRRSTLKSSQIVLLDGSAIRDGPELPEPRYGHCMAYNKDDGVFFSTGGFYKGYKSTVWKFNDPKKFILKGTTQMIKSRRYHGCAILRRSDKHNGRPLLVNAAGLQGSGSSGTGSSDCEFYDYTKPDSQWQLCSKSEQFISALYQLPT